jgi:hypothetical protein
VVRVEVKQIIGLSAHEVVRARGAATCDAYGLRESIENLINELIGRSQDRGDDVKESPKEVAHDA